MTARRRSTRRRKSHLKLVQTLPTRPSLSQRLLRALSATGVAIGAGLVLCVSAVIYMMWSGEANHPAQAVSPAAMQRTPVSADHRAHQIASTQQHVLMARVY